jgi:rifampicin phosphotransferase
MRWFLTLNEIRDSDRPIVGGKAFAMATLQRNGFQVPRSICVPATAYETFMEATGLRERLLLELNRKDFREMRWEEIWDAGLRIRNMFLTKDLPLEIETSLREAVDAHFGFTPVAVRSSSTQEDSSKASFAGLHESFINLRGAGPILEHVKLVWASLWSDSSLLYRQELGLEVEKSAMAVLIQELIHGDRSGIAFTRNPNDASQVVLEAVHGLNQGLVDGEIEPDRWLIDRDSKRVVSHHIPQRGCYFVPSTTGVKVVQLPEGLASSSPLAEPEVHGLADLALSIEASFGRPQDIEWTIGRGSVTVLQSRPITSLPSDSGEDRRAWYLSLRRSFENLQALRRRIESELIPAMIREHESMAAVDLGGLTDRELAREIERRQGVESGWGQVYWDDFIPFAHGMRLFGQVYNDTMRPADPYEFLKLLGNSNLESLQRNRLLEEMASMVRSRNDLGEFLKAGRYLEANPEFVERMRDFIDRFGDLSCPVTGVVQCTQGPDGLIRIILELAARADPYAPFAQDDSTALKHRFLQRFQGDELRHAEELLDLGRASYRLRDDDNIHLARIESQKIAALMEAKRRLEMKGKLDVDPPTLEKTQKALAEIPGARTSAPGMESAHRAPETMKPRQLVGQPAGPGLARGSARVIEHGSDLLEFRRGEVLVCDAVDPNMTYVVPLASAIVERRGGMLIHGAIIAREYGLPCVTGVPDVTRWVRTGDLLTVDGFLGIVSVGSDSLAEGR